MCGRGGRNLSEVTCNKPSEEELSLVHRDFWLWVTRKMAGGRETWETLETVCICRCRGLFCVCRGGLWVHLSHAWRGEETEDYHSRDILPASFHFSDRSEIILLPAHVIVIITSLYSYFVWHQINFVKKTRVLVCTSRHTDERRFRERTGQDWDLHKAIDHSLYDLEWSTNLFYHWLIKALFPSTNTYRGPGSKYWGFIYSFKNRLNPCYVPSID